MNSCDEAIASVFGLNACERKVVAHLCHGKADIDALARICGKSRPRAAQVVSRLLAAGLVRREKTPLARGYKYVYSSAGRRRIAFAAKKELLSRQRTLLRALGV